VRYNRLGEDLQISDQQLIDNLMFTGERPFDVMSVAMKPQDAVRWFTIAPPDLSLIARSRGPDYIYTYLRSFYIDPERPTGVNNVVLHNTNMPHVLWQLQGTQRAVFSTDERGAEVFDHLEVVRPGELDERAFDDVVRDIVNFLDYIGEPIKRERQQLGVRVIGFLLVFLLIAFMLKKEIWKDVT
jgi:ubiquinol-cytochrome c reductase cytochrome c1 subunit